MQCSLGSSHSRKYNVSDQKETIKRESGCLEEKGSGFKPLIVTSASEIRPQSGVLIVMAPHKQHFTGGVIANFSFELHIVQDIGFHRNAVLLGVNSLIQRDVESFC